jgi:hypothetical protein
VSGADAPQHSRYFNISPRNGTVPKLDPEAAKDRTMADVSYLVVAGDGFGFPGRDAGAH